MTRETGKAVGRRSLDPRFTREYLVGQGLDIGSGDDCLGLYRENFSSIQSVRCWDLQDGDAQYLQQIPDQTYDFAVSSHCLEHTDDPRTAMTNWLRVIKPQGHLIVVVPDEDLYEQGNWPSIYNPSHRWTFTIFKRQSWSAVSVNVVDLLRSLPVSIKKIELLDHDFDPTLPPQDQTRGTSESGIEFVVQRC